MSTATTTDLAERIIAALGAHEDGLCHAGICHLSLFGSIARVRPRRLAMSTSPPSSIRPRVWTCSV
jgi:hypothetical protein